MKCPAREGSAYKNGKQKGLQRYWCDRCKWSFTEATSAKVIESLKIQKTEEERE